MITGNQISSTHTYVDKSTYDNPRGGYGVSFISRAFPRSLGIILNSY